MVNSSCWVPTPPSCCNLTVGFGAHDPLFLATAIIGAITEITVIRRLYGRPLETLLAGVKYCNPGCCKADFSAQLKYEISVPITGNLILFTSPDGGETIAIYYRLFIVGWQSDCWHLQPICFTELPRSSNQSCNPEPGDV